jgi:hypothetical protein
LASGIGAYCFCLRGVLSTLYSAVRARITRF